MKHTALTKDQLRLVTIASKARLNIHYRYTTTEIGLGFVVVSDKTVVIRARVVQNKGGTRTYTLINIQDKDSEKGYIVTTLADHVHASESIANAFYNIVLGHDSCPHNSFYWVRIALMLYRPDVKEFEIHYTNGQQEVGVLEC